MKAIHKSISALRSACIGGLLLLAAGCFNGLEAPEAPQGAKNGLVTISIGEEARTIMPDLGQFEELELVITPAAGGEAVHEEAISNGTATVYLDEGAWNLEVNGYVGDRKRATAVNTLTNTKGVVTGNTRFALAPVGTGAGTLEYQITKPAGTSLQAGSKLTLSRADGGPLSLGESWNDGVLALSDSVQETVSLDPGRYTAEVLLLGGDEASAALKETVVILPGLQTDLCFKPASFADPSLLAPLSFGKTANNSSDTRIGAAGGTANERTQAIFAAGVQDTVYFTLAKTAAQSVSLAEGVVGVSQGTAAVDGTAPGAGLEVFTVDTSSIRDGGYREFTLKVTEPGKDAITIAVTVSHGSFGLFIDRGDEETGESLERVESEDETYPIVDLKTALAYLSAFATSDMTYVIYLDEDQAIPPWKGFTGHAQQHITLRLKGIGGPRTVSWDPEEAFEFDWSLNGLFNLNAYTNTTLELDRIILDGKNVPIGRNLSFVYLDDGTTLLLKEGTKLTNFVSSMTPQPNAFGAVIGSNSGAYGTVIMEGGEISGNRVPHYLIPVNAFEMRGGTIRNNNSDWQLLSPFVQEGLWSNTRSSAVQANKFTMTGGAIRDNGRTSVMSGVVVIQEGTMSGGTIEGNGKYRAISGGGVVIGPDCTFTMTGGTIRDNSSTMTLGNAVFVNHYAKSSSGQFILQGSLTLEGRIALSTGSYSDPQYRSIVIVNSPFTNTTGPITLDIHENSHEGVNSRSFIETTDSIALALEYFTFGDYGAGDISQEQYDSYNPVGIINRGKVEEFFTVNPETGVLTYTEPEA